MQRAGDVRELLTAYEGDLSRGRLVAFEVAILNSSLIAINLPAREVVVDVSDPTNVFSAGPSGKSRGVAALLAILIGALGIHYFYVGKNTAGIICLVLTLCSCGWAATLLSIMGIIQGILMFTMTEDDFERRYVYTQSVFPF